MMSAGSRSGVNWMRWKLAWMAAARVAHGERLGQAGHALEQHVAVGEQPDQQPVHQVLLADDDAADLVAERAHPGRGLVDAGVQFIKRDGHWEGECRRIAGTAQVCSGRTEHLTEAGAPNSARRVGAPCFASPGRSRSRGRPSAWGAQCVGREAQSSRFTRMFLYFTTLLGSCAWSANVP